MEEMRHLITLIAAVILLSIAFFMFANNGGNLNLDNQIDISDKIDSLAEAQSRYYGDTLFQYDGKTVIADYFTEEDREVSSLSSYLLITYADTIAIDTCRVIGNGSYVTEGEILKYAIGVDTIRYNMRHLPDSIKPILSLLQSDIIEHRYARGFELNDSSWKCDFKFLAYLPKGYPTWLNQFIATIVRNDIQALYLDNKGADRILKEYYGIKTKPRKVDGINAANMPLEEIAHHFALEHERLYRKEFATEDGKGFGPKYDYMLEVSPAWESSDKRYVTYRFYSYYYTMGAHGFMEEYYLTFNNETGNLLGFDDIIGTASFPKAITLLEQKLTAKESEYRDMDEPYPAAMDAGQLEANASVIIKEEYQGSYYPRPAMTKAGIVFSYQPYEKGAFCEGILHFVIPYSRLKPKIAL